MTALMLKIIALLSMLVDHTHIAFPDSTPVWFRAIGRMAFPIFAYLLADSFCHTRSQEKLLLRLFAFAILAEPIYDRFMGNPFNFFSDANIFYTLFLGGVAIYVHSNSQYIVNYFGNSIVYFVVGICVLTGEIIGVDFMGAGVLLIFLLYRIKEIPLKLIMLVTIMIATQAPFYTLFQMPFTEAIQTGLLKQTILRITAIAVAALLLLFQKQNHEAHTKSPLAKWVFYIAYPAHMVILLALKMM